jgi:general stress protein 26
MTHQDHISRVWDIIEKARIGIVTTQFSDGLRARPLEARANHSVGIIWLLADIHKAETEEINADQDVGLVFVDEDTSTYLCITGRASLTSDTSNEIWKKTDDTRLHGARNDPNVRLLCVEPLTAELWDRPSRVEGAAFEFAKQRLTGERIYFR